jgi:hypothetical protein
LEFGILEVVLEALAVFQLIFLASTPILHHSINKPLKKQNTGILYQGHHQGQILWA